VDGPSGSGKSSASRGAARALGLRYLDTGAMYRALTWWLMDAPADTADEALVASLAAKPVIRSVPTLMTRGRGSTARTFPAISARGRFPLRSAPSPASPRCGGT